MLAANSAAANSTRLLPTSVRRPLSRRSLLCMRHRCAFSSQTVCCLVIAHVCRVAIWPGALFRSPLCMLLSERRLNLPCPSIHAEGEQSLPTTSEHTFQLAGTHQHMTGLGQRSTAIREGLQGLLREQDTVCMRDRLFVLPSAPSPGDGGTNLPRKREF